LTGKRLARTQWQALIGLLGLISALSSTSAAGDDIPQRAIVRFNTICTNCHEGECSGRLSFSSGAAAARQHMQRYLGPIVDADVAAFFGLLRYTKENCAHYPQPARIPDSGIWTAADLKEWRNLDSGAYFIALGHLAPGDYRLQLSFASHAEGRLKITDQHFEPLVEAALSPEAEQEMTFTAMAGAHYLTLHGQSTLTGMALITSAR
jgi:hypothetical protein